MEDTKPYELLRLIVLYGGNQPKGCLTHIVSIPCKKVVSWERYKRKPEVIQLPLLGLDGDHTPAGEALG